MAITVRSSNGVIEHLQNTAEATAHTINLSDAAVGDLRILMIAFGPDGTGTIPSAPTVTGWTQAITSTNTGAASDTRLSVFYRVVQSGDTLTSATLAITTDQVCMTASIAVTLEGIDTTTPLDQTSPTPATGAHPIDSPSITTQTDGAWVVSLGIQDGTSGALVDGNVPTNYTLFGTIANGSPSNGINIGAAYREIATAGAENPPAWGTNTGTEEVVEATFAIRPAAVGISDVVPDEFDMDNADIDVESAGSVFDASGNDVYISDADTLAGSANEVDISSAINTEAVGLINLDLTQLSGTELGNLHTLGPGARYIIVDTAADEHSFPITLHRPEAFKMSAGAGTPGASTARLTPPGVKTTGDFDAGRFEEAANPTTAVDIGVDEYTELVWSIEAKALSREETYDFRVTKNGVPIDTYTVTPQVTVTGAVEDATAESASITEAQTASVIRDASISESCSITEAQTGVDPDSPVVVKTQIFAVPGSTGEVDFNIAGWGDTPKAAMFFLIGTDGTDSFDNNGYLAIGMTDGTTQGCESIYTEDGVTTTISRRASNDAYVVRTARNVSADMDFSAAFNQWNTGGVKLTWSGADIASNTHQVLVVFFAGENLDVDCLYATGNVTLSFAAKLILAACVGETADAEGTWGNLSFGVCTNGTNGLTQQFVEYNNEEAVAAGDMGMGLENTYITGQEFDGWNWRAAVSAITGSGFTLSTVLGGDRVLMLCFNFPEDVDSGVATVPTSGDIAVTAPGFEPQFVGLMGVDVPAVNTWYESNDPSGMWIGAYDGTRENSVLVSAEDGGSPTNETSVHSSEVIHWEDPDQVLEFESSAITFDADGFDITIDTNPGAVSQFIWWAIETGTPAPPTGTVAESCSITEAQTAQQTSSVATAESASISEAQTASQVMSASCGESVSVNDTPSAQAELEGTGSESASADDAPSAVGTLAATATESASVQDTPTGLEINEAAIAESASVNETSTTQQTSSVGTDESASADDAQTAAKLLEVTGTESASITEEQTSASAQNVETTESASITEAQTTTHEHASAGDESLSVDDGPTVQSNQNVAVTESASITEAQISDEENEASQTESVSVDDTPAGQQVSSVSVAETATVDEAQTADRVLEDVGAESASIDDSPVAQVDFNATGAESASVGEVQSGIGEDEEEVTESASIDDVPTVQAELNASDAESASITEAQTGSVVRVDAVSESASVSEEQTADSDLISTGAESASITEAQSAQAELNATTDESVNIGEVQTGSEENAAITVESASVNDEPTASGTGADSTSESASADDTPSAIRELVAAVAESASINDTPDSDIAEIGATISESATANDECDAQLIKYADITEDLAVASIQAYFSIFEDTVTESATINELPTFLGIAAEILDGVSRITRLIDKESKITILLDEESTITTELNITSKID